MGIEKSELIDREENWLRKARAEGLKCGRCSLTIQYDERESYFRTEVCGYCANAMSKDD